MNKKHIGLMIFIVGTIIVSSSMNAVSRTTIKNTKHNLSSWGQYDVKAQSESQVCKFCHAPHNTESTQAPLWVHKETSSTFIVVSTAYAGKNQPSGIARKCLSCHDGTVGIGASLTNDPGIAMQLPSNQKVQPVTFLLQSSTTGRGGYLGTTLRGRHFHPVSFNYRTAATAKNNVVPNTFVIKSNPSYDYGLSATNNVRMLDRNGKVQCHTCHDPHNDWGNCSLADPTQCSNYNYAKGKAVDPLWRKPMDCTGDSRSVCGACHIWLRYTAESGNCDPNFDQCCPESDYDN